jgi:2,3-bisphosphoglycerate-dependent phosphoglycerate mutase
MQLYFIRHGESTNNVLGTSVGRTQDPTLTLTGLKQAEAVAAHLADKDHPESRHEDAGYHFDHLYCSPMTRALQTAQPIAQALGLQTEVWVEIHEQGGIYLDAPDGQQIGYPGLTRQAILEQFPGYRLPDNVTDEGWWTGGYESIGQAAGRAIDVAERLLQRAYQGDEILALVGHGMFTNLLLKALLNQLPSAGVYYRHYNTGITRVNIEPDGFVELRYLNRVNHLPPELLTL